MTASRRSATGWALLATAGAGVAALLVGGAVVVVAGDRSSPTTSTTTTARGTTTTTRPPDEASLVTEEQSAFRIVWHGVVVTGDELLAVAPGAPDASAWTVLVDPAFVEMQEDAGVELGRLRAQLSLAARRLGPVALAGTAPGPPSTYELAVVGPPTAEAGGLVVPVMVFNTAEVPRALATVDLRLLGGDGEAVTELVRFADGLGEVVPPRSAYFNSLLFSSDQVTASGAAPDVVMLEANLGWAMGEARGNPG